MRLSYFSLSLASTKAAIFTEKIEDDNYLGAKGQLYRSKPLSESDRAAILQAHNEVRDEAANGLLNNNKKASKLYPLSWDSDLEESAQQYANQCNWAHSNPAGFRAVPWDYSENLWVTSAYGVDDMTLAIDSWAAENIYYNHNTNECEDGQQCGHYTQIVWEGTRRVGCAISECNNVNNIGWGGGTLVVCQYYPPGNNAIETPYSYAGNTAEPGASCPDGLDDTYDGLCAIKGNPICKNDNRCMDPSATCRKEGDYGYSCDCTEKYFGRWCQKHTCGTVTIEDKAVGQQGWIWENNQPKYFQNYQEEEALAFCDQMNEDKPNSCAGVTRRKYISWYFWYPLAVRNEAHYETHIDGRIVYRDCSSDDDGSDDQDDNTVITTTIEPTTEEPVAPLNYDDITVEMKLVGSDGKIRLGADYDTDLNNKCLGIDPTIKNGQPKPWHYNSQIKIQDCIDLENLPYEGDHQSWIYDEIEGTICTGHRTANMVQKNFRYCILSNYKQGGNRPLKLEAVYPDDTLRYGVQFDYEAGQIVGRHANPKEVVVWKDSGDTLWVKKMKTNSHFGSIDAKFESL